MTMTTETVRDVADEIDDDHVHGRTPRLRPTDPVPPALARHITGAYRRIPRPGAVGVTAHNLRDVVLAMEIRGTGDMAGALLMRDGTWINRLDSPEHPPALARAVDRWIETHGPAMLAQARADGLIDKEHP